MAGGARARRGYNRASVTLSLRPFGSVLGPPLLAVLNATGIQGAADDVVTNAGQILDSPTAYQHHRVLLKVVPLAWDVRRNFHLIG